MSGFDFDVIRQSLAYMFFDGMRFTVTLTVLAALGGAVLGTALALLRQSGNAVFVALVAGYVNLIRSLPLVLVIFWFYFLVPFVAQWATGAKRPMEVGAFSSALVTFIMFEAAYFSEIVRAGIISISRGQTAAGYAIGLRYTQVMRHIILPQVLRNMLPVMVTQTIVLFQDTSLVYVLGLTDFMGAASKVAERDGRPIEMYTFAAVVYLIVCCTASYLARRMQSKISTPR